ncbi:MAG: dioxygenase family protein [Betaproteobacteria bacterium]
MATDTTRRRMLFAGLALLPLPGLARAQQCRVTPRDALGPFYKPNAPAQAELCAGGSGGAPKLLVTGRVFAMPDCRPLPGALVEVWQADAAGHYTQVGSKKDDEACLLRARLTTDSEGRYRFSTILPGEYPGRPRHIHYRVSHPKHPPLVTQLYFERQRGVPDALVVAVASGAPGAAAASFDITLAAT